MPLKDPDARKAYENAHRLTAAGEQARARRRDRAKAVAILIANHRDEYEAIVSRIRVRRVARKTEETR